MSMSKKDYEAIALVLRRARDTEEVDVISWIGASIANHCSKQSPTFSYARFFAAAGIDPERKQQEET